MSEGSSDQVRAFLDLWDTRPQYTENIYGLGEESVVWLTTDDLRSLLAELDWLRDRNPLEVQRYRILNWLASRSAPTAKEQPNG